MKKENQINDWNLLFNKPVVQLDQDGIFVTETTADLDVYAQDGSYLIPAGCIDAPPPEKRDGFAAKWQFDTQTWAYLPDHRGKILYDTTTGEAIEIQQVGELPVGATELPRPSLDHVWNGSEWAIPPEIATQIEQQQFQAARAEKLAQLNQTAQAFINQAAGLDQVPEFELQTWVTQGAEAKAWHDNPNAPTPTLDAIAAARNIPAEILKQKAYEKTVKFELLTAHIAGIRQGIADQINAAQDLETLDHIVIRFTLPEMETAS